MMVDHCMQYEQNPLFYLGYISLQTCKIIGCVCVGNSRVKSGWPVISANIEGSHTDDGGE